MGTERAADSKGRILVVDDEVNARTALAELLAEEGYVVESAADAFKALGKVAEFSPDLVLTDLKMPGMDGLQLLARLHEGDRDVPVIVMTAFGEVESAVRAMRAGARDYLAKPVNVGELSVVVARELDQRRVRIEAELLRERLSEKYSFENIIGNSTPMQNVFKTVAQIAASRASVLVTGESGTGKELIAAAIHERSPRAKGPFVKLHCAALAESLLESELFGHERGSFTGAMTRRDGRFFQANHGTLFLDEIGEISPAIQVKLLRFLQEREFERVGGNETISVDVRVIAATNRNLQHMVSEGKFREDLYYRINTFVLRLPPLRHRKDDIAHLASQLLQQLSREIRRPATQLDPDAEQALVEHTWPGNVRELRNVLERAMLVCSSAVIRRADLRLGPSGGRPAPVQAATSGTLEEVEWQHIQRVLKEEGGSVGRAARRLGIPRSTLYQRLKVQDARRPSPDA